MAVPTIEQPMPMAGSRKASAMASSAWPSMAEPSSLDCETASVAAELVTKPLGPRRAEQPALDHEPDQVHAGAARELRGELLKLIRSGQATLNEELALAAGQFVHNGTGIIDIDEFRRSRQ